MRLCIHWPRFGPLHLARLRATAQLFSSQASEIVALETAGNDRLYEWRVETRPEPFPRTQVFPDKVFEDISPKAMHAGVTKVLDELDPDAVAIMSWGFSDARAALLWCRRRRRAAILMAASKESDAPRVPWREFVKSRIIKQFDAAIVGGSPQRDYAMKLGLPKEVIFEKYNAVDNDYFEQTTAAIRANPQSWRGLPGLEDEQPLFLASNRFIARKNLPLLLEAYGDYRDCASRAGFHPWRLVMLGDGRLRGELEGLTEALGIEGVVFAGFRQIDEIPAYYALASAFVHPAAVDQWALVVNEAMASGLPVIVSTGSGCHHDLVEQGVNGFRFDPDDKMALVEALLTLSSPGTDLEAMGERSREIVSRWSPDRFAESMWYACETALKRADRRPDPLALAVLYGINRFARHHRAFHTVEV